MATVRIAVTADLHWGHNARGDEATTAMRDMLQARPPDLLLLAGDIGTSQFFAPCLELFAGLPCPKALVPGNHDLWVVDDDDRGDSMDLYRTVLPALCSRYGFHYLDHGPLYLDDARLAVVGTINWYDYSWSIARLRQEVPDWEDRLRRKAFSRGRHNDARFIRWPLDDVRFTDTVLETFAAHLHEALSRADHAIVVTHHPPRYGLGFPRPGRPSVPDGLLWDAFCGNDRMEQLLDRHADRIPFIFCGHTHRAREDQHHSTRGINIGGDYPWKRLVLLDWPAGTVEAHVFGDAGPAG